MLQNKIQLKPRKPRLRVYMGEQTRYFPVAFEPFVAGLSLISS